MTDRDEVPLLTAAKVKAWAYDPSVGASYLDAELAAIEDGRAVVVRPINREALINALGEATGRYIVIRDAQAWSVTDVMAALVRLGVAKE